MRAAPFIPAMIVALLVPPVAEPQPPPPTSARPTGAPDDALAPILLRAAGYVEDYEHAFSDLVAEETYTQRSERQQVGTLSASLPGGPGEAMGGEVPTASMPNSHETQQRRVTKADLVFVRLGGPLPWASYRDVFEVDGRAVRDHEQRLLALFSKSSPEAHQRARALLDASAQYNIGQVDRNINLPTLPLLFLLPENQPRFAFELGRSQTIHAAETRIVAFREVARPTFVRGPKDTDLLTSGRFWISPNRGTVVRSEVRLDFGPGAEAVVTTEYQPEPTLVMWVPSEMKERYADRPGARTPTFPESFRGEARYANFRRFTVSTQEKVAAPGQK